MRDKAPFRCKREKQNLTMLASARRAENGLSLHLRAKTTSSVRADIQKDAFPGFSLQRGILDQRPSDSLDAWLERPIW